MIKHELHCIKVRTRQKEHFVAGDVPRYLSLGCGGIYLPPDWIGFDVYARGQRIRRYDCRTKLPFPDGSIEIVHAEHFLEHIDRYEHAEPLLIECLRCLKPGGFLRLVVPDGEAYINAYHSKDWQQITRLRPLQAMEDGTYYDPLFDRTMVSQMDVLNVVFHQWGEHYYAYDYQTLEKILGRCGFSSVSRCSYVQSSHPEWATISPELAGRSSYSLYIEAHKPEVDFGLPDSIVYSNYKK
jgi:predicted SAM-dependent methyltransferase